MNKVLSSGELEMINEDYFQLIKLNILIPSVAVLNQYASKMGKDHLFPEILPNVF